MDQRKEKNIPYLGKHEIVLMVEEIEALQHMHIRNTAQLVEKAEPYSKTEVWLIGIHNYSTSTNTYSHCKKKVRNLSALRYQEVIWSLAGFKMR